ncbi:MAG: SMI1/KNR4 family protein [Candidatus Peregrinibacteria bacterium]|nr:SMI1/KNR4 family protein [Candidatus Peregrinibacteria bacterium]
MNFDCEYHSVTDETLKKFIKQQRLKKFPLEYSNFLMKYNGGTTSHDGFIVHDCEVMEDSILSFFYSIDPNNLNSKKVDTLSYALETFRHSIPNDTLPIATDDFGNIICLILKGKNKNKIFIWVHDYPAEEGSWDNMFFIANDFSSFLDHLEETGVYEIEFDEEKDVCRKGDFDSLNKILKQKPSTERVIQLAESCAAFGHINLLELISEKGYPINDPVIAWQAFVSKEEQTVLYLLENHADINHVLEGNSTWLHLAARYNLPVVVEYLIDNGCSPTCKNSKGITPYSEARFGGANNIAELLMKYMRR